MNVQSAAESGADDYPTLLEAGLNDWGGISPVTKDFINPEATWPQITMLGKRYGRRRFSLRERLAIYPEYAHRADFVDERLSKQLERHRGADGYARVN